LSLPPPPSTRAALGTPPPLPPWAGGSFSQNATAGHTSCRDRRPPISLLSLLNSMRDMDRWFPLLPFSHGDGAQIVPEQPRRPQDHPLLGPCRQLGLRHRGTPLQFMLGFFGKSMRFVDCNDAPNVISQ
jgi:hypothetical protein